MYVDSRKCFQNGTPICCIVYVWKICMYVSLLDARQDSFNGNSKKQILTLNRCRESRLFARLARCSRSVVRLIDFFYGRARIVENGMSKCIPVLEVIPNVEQVPMLLQFYHTIEHENRMYMEFRDETQGFQDFFDFKSSGAW